MRHCEIATLLEIGPDLLMAEPTIDGQYLNIAFELARLEFDWRTGALNEEENCLLRNILMLAIAAQLEQNEAEKIQITQDLVRLLSKDEPKSSAMH